VQRPCCPNSMVVLASAPQRFAAIEYGQRPTVRKIMKQNTTTQYASTIRAAAADVLRAYFAELLS